MDTSSPTSHTQAELGARLAAAELDSLAKALVLMAHGDPERELSVWQLSQALSKLGLGNPNRQDLEKKLGRSDLTLKGRHGYRLRAGARQKIALAYPALFKASPVLQPIQQVDGYLPLVIWENTRGYLEKVCRQLNGCYQSGFFDAASVMLRRAVETLVIEAFEADKREALIKGKDGYYLSFGDLIEIVSGSDGLSLGRDSQRTLKELKKLGDRAAHNRRFNAISNDLDEVRSGARLLVNELVAMAGLQRNNGGIA